MIFNVYGVYIPFTPEGDALCLEMGVCRACHGNVDTEKPCLACSPPPPLNDPQFLRDAAHKGLPYAIHRKQTALLETRFGNELRRQRSNAKIR